MNVPKHIHTWIGDDCPEGWRRVGSIDVADPADTFTARDRGRRIGTIYDGCSGSVAEPCCADTYARTELGERFDELQWKIEDLREEAAHQEARFSRLLIAFHDAIRRPLGVTPDSGAEFYDPRMADEAEARRSGRRVLRELSPDEAAARAAALADARRREEQGGSSAA